MKVLDLFSGIGAFSLGLERAGMRTVAFCEIDPWCRRVLAKHWPETPCYDDVRSLTAERLRADGISVDVICGGFPCQDISSAGGKAGIGGEQSCLWAEFARLIGELRPRYALVENVADLLSRGFGEVLGGLAALGYDAEWHCIPAAAVGAPHVRDRVWVIAYPDGCWKHALPIDAEVSGIPPSCLADADRQPILGPSVAWQECNPWSAESGMGRVAHGIANRVDRLRGLGNSLVPQIPELIGRAILEACQ